MRIPRFVLALLLIGTPVATVAVTATSAAAEPFTYSQVSIGHSSICVLTTQHQVLCKGDNYNGFLVPDTNDRTVTQFTRINLPHGEQWDSIHSGTSSTHCGRTVSHRAFCWGEGRLGSYFTTVSRIPVQVEFPNDVRINDVKAGYSTACAIDINDDLWCWGDANYIGNGDIEPMRIPVRVPMPDSSKVTQLSMGPDNVCVSTDSNQQYCWGSNAAGQLGLGYPQQFPYSFSWLPVSLPAPQGKQWAQLPAAIGIGRICAITTDGAGYCAGDNYGGSFGNATYDDSYTFVRMTVPDNESITSMSSGFYHTCLTTSSGKMYCIGDSSTGQFGTGTTLGGKTYRTPLLPDTVSLSRFDTAESSTCVLDTESQIWCMGLINGGPVYSQYDTTNLFPRQLPPIGTPTANAPEISNIDSETATITGIVNPNGYATTAFIEVSSSSLFVGATQRLFTTQPLEPSYSFTSRAVSFENLAPRTLYYVRVTATNALGSTTSDTSSFTTLGTEPTVSEVNISNITGNEAETSFTVNPGRLSTTMSAEFSTDINFQNDLQSYPLASASGRQDVTRTVYLTGLQPRTRYYTRAVATNRLGSTTGSIQSFLTIGSLSAINRFTVDSEVRSVTVNVTATTGDTAGSVRAEASTTSDFANVLASASSGFSSSGPTDHQLFITGLTARTNYFVRVIVTNQIGITTSSVETIRTLGGAPSVGTPIVSPTPRGATLQLQFDANGLDTSVKLIFSAANDADDPFEHFIRQSDVMGLQTVDYTLYELRPAVTYYVTLVATNYAGTATSSQVSFTTPGPIGVIINNDDNSSELSTVSLTITPPSGAVAMRVSNNKSFRSAKVLPLTSTMTWELLASDEEITERFVYVQFYFRDGTSVIYEDDIYLMTDVTSPDEDAPVVTAMSVAKTRITAAGATTMKSASTVTISARDKMSGIVRIETKIRNRISSKRVEATRRGTYTVSIPKGEYKMHVRVIDKAGNKSKWITARRK